MNDVEAKLRSALRPVDPPGRLSDRLEARLVEVADAAAEELADWEIGAMRDPRNWARPAAAAVAGAAAGGALIVVRARRGQRQRNANRARELERTLRELADAALKRR